MSFKDFLSRAPNVTIILVFRFLYPLFYRGQTQLVQLIGLVLSIHFGKNSRPVIQNNCENVCKFVYVIYYNYITILVNL